MQTCLTHARSRRPSAATTGHPGTSPPRSHPHARRAQPHKACAAMQGLGQTGGVDINNPNQSDHGGLIIHPPQQAYIDTTFPCYQLADLKLSSLSMDHQVLPLTDLAPASAAECAIRCNVPHREAVNTSNWAVLATHPATTFANADGSMAVLWRAMLGHAFPIDGNTIPCSRSSRRMSPRPSTRATTSQRRMAARRHCALAALYQPPPATPRPLSICFPTIMQPLRSRATINITLRTRPTHWVTKKLNCPVPAP